jgi:hypothetical protein
MSMTLRIPGASRLVAGRPVPVGPGSQRKVGLLGGASLSLACAPFLDPSWTFWAHASITVSIPHLRADRLFDLHPRNVFTIERKNGFANYYGFLQHCPTPIYMQERYPEIRQSVRYPLEMVRQQWPGVPFGSTTAFMIALALLEGVTHIGLWGTDYSHGSEYDEQRANAEMWVGIAMGHGVQIIIPAVSPLCHEPALLYGYESHTPELFAKRIERFKRIKEKDQDRRGAFKAARLQPIVGQAGLDAAAALRQQRDPHWAKVMDELKHDQEPSGLPVNIGVPPCDEDSSLPLSSVLPASRPARPSTKRSRRSRLRTPRSG